MTPTITAGSADVLAQIMARHQNDEFFASVIQDFIVRAKLKYDGLSRVFELAQKRDEMWARVRTLEQAIKDPQFSADELRSMNNELWITRETYIDLQTECRRAQRVVEEQICPTNELVKYGL